jgi:hypothetical protein
MGYPNDLRGLYKKGRPEERPDTLIIKAIMAKKKAIKANVKIDSVSF